LVDVVVADENLNQGSLSYWSLPARPPLCPLVRGGGERTKRISVPQAVAYRIERGEISERAADVHGAREGFLLRREVA
jgi:hypothetical protein